MVNSDCKTIKVRRLEGNTLPLPRPSKNNAAEFDIYVAGISYDYGRDLVYVKTGFIFYVPTDYHLEVILQPSIAKRGYILANGTEVVAADNHNELVLMLRWCHQGDECIDIGNKVGIAYLVRDVSVSIQEIVAPDEERNV